MAGVIASSDAMHASFKVTPRSGVINVRMRGELDLESADGLTEVLHSLNPHPGDLVQLDAREVTFMDCSALVAISVAKDAFDESGVTLWIVSPSLCVRALLDMTASGELLAPGDQTELHQQVTGFRYEPC